LNFQEIKGLRTDLRNHYLASLLYQNYYSSVEVKSVSIFNGHTNYVQVVQHLYKNLKNKNLIATASWDKTIRIWDISINKCLKILNGHHKCINDLAYLYEVGSEGDIIASGGVDDLIMIWKVNDNQFDQPINQFSANCTYVYSLIYLNIIGNLDRDLIACCGQNATIKIYKAMSGQCLQTIYAHFDYIFTLVHLEDYMEKNLDDIIEDAVNNLVDEDIPEEINTNDYIVSGGNDYVIKVWKLDSDTCIKELSGHENTIRKIIYMKNFKKENNDYICSCSTDDTVKVWKAIEGQCLYSVISHLNGVCSLTFLDDTEGKGFYIVSGGTNLQKTIKLWKVGIQNKSIILEFLNEMDIQHQDSIRYLSFIYYNKKNILLSTSWDNNINIIDFYNL
jgi:WD40 repeat protein